MHSDMHKSQSITISLFVHALSSAGCRIHCDGHSSPPTAQLELLNSSKRWCQFVQYIKKTIKICIYNKILNCKSSSSRLMRISIMFNGTTDAVSCITYLSICRSWVSQVLFYGLSLSLSRFVVDVSKDFFLTNAAFEIRL